MAAITTETTPDMGGERPASGQASPPKAPSTNKRVRWRAIVRTGGQVSANSDRDRVEWHLAACAARDAERDHCTEGRHLLETIGHPDGHCVIDGVCGLCGAEAPSD